MNTRVYDENELTCQVVREYYKQTTTATTTIDYMQQYCQQLNTICGKLKDQKQITMMQQAS